MRLNATLASRLGISRRLADKYISDGLVTVNGKTGTLGQKINEDDSLLINNKMVPKSRPFSTLMLNKPVGLVCSRRQQDQSKTVYSLLPAKFNELKIAGRLDKDSSGLLILSNNGQLIYKLTHPSMQKEKVYQITLNKPLDISAKGKIESGVALEDGLSKLKLTGSGLDWTVSMKEGRNRQIRRTFDKIGYKVKSLHRIKIGQFKLDSNLNPGKFTIVK